MFGKTTILVVFLATLFLSTTATAETIAEYTGTSNHGVSVSTTFTPAMAFDVTGSPTVTEIQLYLRRSHVGSAGYVAMSLHRDVNGEPESGVVATISRPVSDVFTTEGWVSFKWFGGGGTTISPGRWWITCRVSNDCDTTLTWKGVDNNPYNTSDDTKTSMNGGASWPIIQSLDLAFRVFGTRTIKNTTTTVTATPSTVAVSGAATIDVTVRDSSNNLIQGPGTVTLSCPAGTFGSTTLTLNNGQASTTWTSPGSLGSQTITANYNAHSFAGVDYNASNDTAAVNVIAETRSTTTNQTLSPNSTTTRSSINISVSVLDSLSQPVTGGSVSFDCAYGSFSTNPVNLVNGNGATTWTASNTTGTLPITASYSGFDAGTIVYGGSSDVDNVTVDYTNVATSTTLKVDPGYPYIGKTTFAIATVRDNTGTLVPGGNVQISAPSGWFDSTNFSLSGGIGYTKWHAPATAGSVTITANYQQHLDGGNRYLTSNDIASATVVSDSDSTGTGLRWVTDWISDYDTNPLPNSKAQSEGFSDTLTSELNWGGSAYANTVAWEDDMKKSSKGGQENTYMDNNDFQWYNGHGNPDYITFISDHDDNKLKHSDAYDSWGTKDCDWATLKTCKALSHDSYWASTMNGIHLICGFHTNAQSSTTFGQVFASFMIKENVFDKSHRIYQAWFLAGDQTHSNDKKQRVIGESSAMFTDHIWGQGFVNADPTADDYYSSREHDVTGLTGLTAPTADASAGEPYTATTGQVFRLDASNSSDPDVGDYIFYAWDLDPTTNTDSGDWDADGTDEVNDDADIWGRRPQTVFLTPGTKSVKLIVIDDDWKTSFVYTSVTVTDPPFPAPPPQQTPGLPGDGGITIVDNYGPLPPETTMPYVKMIGTAVGYSEMSTIAAGYGLSGSSQIDGVGNWNMVDGDSELLVNQVSGSVMYVDTSKAYIYSTPPAWLPSDAEAIQIADTFVAQNGILCPDMTFESVTDITASETQKDSRTRISITPFQRKVNYRRNINVYGTLYPVVGPGGKVSVLIDETGEVVMFNKICRNAYVDEDGPLTPPEVAIGEFHRLGTRALISDCVVPPCDRIEIDNVTLGYYEGDFVTNQQTIEPVYILDLTIEDDQGSQQVQVYMPAMSPPLEPMINSPSAGAQVNFGDSVTFDGTAAGGPSLDPMTYIYNWYSDIDGFIGSGPNMNYSSLSVNVKDGEVLPHTISLTVSDPLMGFENTAFVTVTVSYKADFDDSGVLDNKDLAVFINAWASSIGDANYDDTCDFVDDDVIRFDDYAVLAFEWASQP